LVGAKAQGLKPKKMIIRFGTAKAVPWLPAEAKAEAGGF
jgi:hypothetical protein